MLGGWDRRWPPDRSDAMETVPDDVPPLERPSSGSPLVNVLESAARYAFAAAAVRTLRVLDVASGSGLGSEFLLAQGARFVVGVEAAPEALGQTRLHPAPADPHFVRADATTLPFMDASFDVVVSFETIEHVPDARRLLAECRRILRRDGCLYLSTPNRTVTRWLPPNPFHVREFTDVEIVRLASEYFGSVTSFWQRPVFSPAFVLRQIVRQSLTILPGGRGVRTAWNRMRPERTQAGATVWQGSRFDHSLLQDPYYGVVPARRTIWWRPMFTVVVARS